MNEHTAAIDAATIGRVAETFEQAGGWEMAKWPYSNGTTRKHLAGIPELRDAERLLGQNGFAVVEMSALLSMPEPVQVTALTAITSAFGRPIRVFDAQTALWRTLDVDLSRPSGRSRGTGAQPLHLDFVNAAMPPDYVYLYCLRPDPRGGGGSIVAGVNGLENALSPSARSILSQPCFVDGRVSGLLEVGGDINPFPVLNSEALAFKVRYTGQLLRGDHDQATAEALCEMDDILRQRTTTLPLASGQLLVLDQRRVLHGRRALGDNQESLPEDRRRLLKHGFGRDQPNSQ